MSVRARGFVGGTGAVALATLCLVGLLTLLADWGEIARKDPARALGRGPNAIAVLGADADRPGFGLADYIPFVAAGVAFIACGMIAAHGQAPGLTASLLYAAGGIWLMEGLRLSSAPLLFTLGTQMNLLTIPILIHLGLSFPEGRLSGPAARRFVITLYVYYVMHNVSLWVVFDPRIHVSQGESTSVNLLLISDQPELYKAFREVHAAIFFVIGATLIVIMSLRWRRGSPALRYTLLPLWWAFFIVTIVKVWSALAAIDLPGTDGWFRYAIRYWSPMLIPIAVLIGLARYRLARGAVSRMMVDLGTGPVTTERLQVLLRQTMHDPSAELWFWSKADGSYTNTEGRRVALDAVTPPRSVTALESKGSRMGVLVHDISIARQPDVLEAVRASTTLLLENLQLTQSLEDQLEATRQSRQRIVAASDAERRRLERDIHDGAQQQLVAAAIILRRAGRATDNSQTRAMLDEGSTQLELAIVGLRELALGVHPPVLQDRGLSAALSSLAERVTIPVDIIDRYQQRAPGTIEACLYFSASEAITNAVRHSGASHLEIELAESDGLLTLRVTDDGCGGVILRPSGGIAGLHDRVAALNGRLEVDSLLGRGTSVSIQVPLPVREAGR